MKYLAIVFLACLGACSVRERKDYMALSVIVDSSDFHLLHPNTESIIALLNLKDHKNEGVSFRYSMVSDKVLSPVTIVRVPNSQEDNINSQIPLSERSVKAATFYKSIRSLLSQPIPESGYLQRSQCFHTICRELQALKQKPSKEMILLIYSNLYENSDLFSIYSNEGKQILDKKPDEIMALFEKQKLLPNDLSHIKVVFVYQPISIDDDKTYNTISEIYKSILEKRHAIVTIQADNQIAVYE